MKYVSVITDYTYLIWQQELQAFNFKQLGIADKLVCVVLHEPDQPLSDRAKKLSQYVETHYYPNDQVRRHYIPSNKPWGLMKLLKDFPEYGEKLFLLDSDVIFRETLDFSKLDYDDNWYFSNTIGYIAHHYLDEMLGHDLVDSMASIVGLTADRLKAEQNNSGGAQYYMKGVTAEFCRKVALDSVNIYDWAIQQRRPDGSYKIQVWTAEMWSWLWNSFLVANVRVHPEMDFAWAPHDVSDWHAKKMMHLAGVTGQEPGNFFKGKYPQAAPWEVEKDFLHVNRSKCWAPYVELIEQYKPEIHKNNYRAIVCYLDDTPSLVKQAKSLIQSLKYINCSDTDLVIFGPETALVKLKDFNFIKKVVQNPHLLAKQYGYINSISCLNFPGSEILDKYHYLLKSDLDTFITPAWSKFKPTTLTVGQGFYSNSDDIRQRCEKLALNFNLNYKKLYNLGSTFYGPTKLVREICQLATTLCEYLLTVEFKDHHGEWPHWFRGVSSMYATEVAINHCAESLVGPSKLLDFFSTSTESVQDYPHVHCWHTNELFSKFEWEKGSYANTDFNTLDLNIIRDYCLAMALSSIDN